MDNGWITYFNIMIFIILAGCVYDSCRDTKRFDKIESFVVVSVSEIEDSVQNIENANDRLRLVVDDRYMYLQNEIVRLEKLIKENIECVKLPDLVDPDDDYTELCEVE